MLDTEFKSTSNLEVVYEIVKNQDFTSLVEIFSKQSEEVPKANQAFEKLYGNLKYFSCPVKYDRIHERLIRREVGELLSLYNREDVQFLFLDSKEITAFALSGVAIAFTYGFLEILTSQDELRAVVAHELSHQVFAKLSEEARQSKVRTESSNAFRTIEFLCDVLGVRALQHLGRRADGLIEFLEKYPMLDGFYHPSSTSRIELIKRITV